MVYSITAQMKEDICWISIERDVLMTLLVNTDIPRRMSTYTFNGDLVSGDLEILLYRSTVLDNIYTDANLLATVQFKITDK